MPRVLVVDDDPGLRELLSASLGFSGFEVVVAEDVTSGLRVLAEQDVDAAVVDVGLPDAEGFDLVRLLRSGTGPAARAKDLPVLLLTARDGVDDRVHGLRTGADDYLTKPFSVVELGARLEALLRRAGRSDGPAEPGPLRVADLELDEGRHVVTRAGMPITLSPTEFRLLHFLLGHAGQVVSKGQILQHVWQYDFGGDTNVVERFVSNLRRKVDDGREPLLHTVRGFGYRIGSG